MLKISWSEKVTNDDEVLVHANETRSILRMIWHGAHKWVHHIFRYEGILQDIIEGKMMGKAT